MIQNDQQLHQAEADVQTLWRVLERAQQTHQAVDYERLAAPPISCRFRNVNKTSWVIYRHSK